MDPITQSVRSFIAETFYVRDLSVLEGDVSLLDQGIVDSTGVLELTAFLESTYGISIADEEIIPENLDTVDRIVAFVHRKQAVAAA